MEDKCIVLAIQKEPKKPQKWTKTPKTEYYSKTSKRESSNGYVNENGKGNLNTIYKCKKINKEHGPRNDPAFERTCKLCIGLNHYAIGNTNNKKVQQITKKYF